MAKLLLAWEMVSVPDITQGCDKLPIGLHETRIASITFFHMAKYTYSKISFQSPSPSPFDNHYLLCLTVAKSLNNVLPFISRGNVVCVSLE